MQPCNVNTQYHEEAARHRPVLGNLMFCWDMSMLHHVLRIERDGWKYTPSGWWGRRVAANGQDKFIFIFECFVNNKEANKWSTIDHWSYNHCYTLGRYQWKRWWKALGEYAYVAKLPSRLRVYIGYIMTLYTPPHMRAVSSQTGTRIGFLNMMLSDPPHPSN